MEGVTIGLTNLLLIIQKVAQILAQIGGIDLNFCHYYSPGCAKFIKRCVLINLAYLTPTHIGLRLVYGTPPLTNFPQSI